MLRRTGFPEDVDRNADCRFTLCEEGGHTDPQGRPQNRNPRTD